MSYEGNYWVATAFERISSSSTRQWVPSDDGIGRRFQRMTTAPLGSRLRLPIPPSSAELIPTELSVVMAGRERPLGERGLMSSGIHLGRVLNEVVRDGVGVRFLDPHSLFGRSSRPMLLPSFGRDNLTSGSLSAQPSVLRPRHVPRLAHDPRAVHPWDAPASTQWCVNETSSAGHESPVIARPKSPADQPGM
jgi:hypothetical protein